MPKRKAFTLIELLVVIAIIALLLAILMPALGKVKYAAKRIVCQTQIRDQATSLYTYAVDNDDKYPENNGNGPTYHRSSIVPAGVDPVRFFDVMYGSYITNTDVMFCPLLIQMKGANEKEYYAPSGYGGWDIMEWSGMSDQGGDWDPSSGPPTFVVSSYAWLVNFREDSRATPVTFLEDAVPWPKSISESTSRTPIITHEMSGDGSGIIYWDVSHGGDPSLYGTGTPVEDMKTIDNPVGYGDGSVTYHKKNEMKARADVSHGGPYFYYY